MEHTNNMVVAFINGVHPLDCFSECTEPVSRIEGLVVVEAGDVQI